MNGSFIDNFNSRLHSTKKARQTARVCLAFKLLSGHLFLLGDRKILYQQQPGKALILNFQYSNRQPCYLNLGALPFLGDAAQQLCYKPGNVS